MNLKKKDDVKKQTFKYSNEKGEGKTLEFYDYYNHLKKHVFKWLDSLISYEIKISPDGKHLII